MGLEFLNEFRVEFDERYVWDLMVSSFQGLSYFFEDEGLSPFVGNVTLRGLSDFITKIYS
jgi:hypothetical protein